MMKRPTLMKPFSKAAKAPAPSWLPCLAELLCIFFYSCEVAPKSTLALKAPNHS